jgi:copper chaperone CopZ
MSNIELKITGMTCGACVAHVTKALEQVSGVRSAQVDLAGQTARVEGDGLDSAALVAAVEAEDYGAAPLESQETVSTLPTTGTGCSCCDS